MDRPLQKANIKNDLNPILKTKIKFFLLQLSSAHSWCFEASSVIKKGKEPITLRPCHGVITDQFIFRSILKYSFLCKCYSIRYVFKTAAFNFAAVHWYMKKCHQDLKFQMIRFMFFFSGLFLILPWNANISFVFNFTIHTPYSAVNT